MTIPIVSSSETTQLTSQYHKRGFKTLKLKVGKDLNKDIEVLQAVRAAHPECMLILDANEGYNSTEAIQVLETLHGFSSQVAHGLVRLLEYHVMKTITGLMFLLGIRRFSID
ncbi:hypothetical protein POM88_021815 [Heracleum sosnowskyi]|uniref:Enolase C-terminal domain-containing protein n=1 Tax=Heracleum sosnowskyi TaxID=360622 RepID=A0AAD8IE54_9APIA|nr:hypothetical protein POM88_021815 [Heracleum sosnowskyi]